RRKGLLAGFALGALGRLLALLGGGVVHNLKIDAGRAQLLKPRMQVCGRNAVILVVGGNRIENGVVLGEAPPLVFDDTVGRSLHLAAALAPVKSLKVLDRV